MRRRAVLGGIAAAGAALAGCIGGSGGPSNGTEVSVSEMGYNPRNLDVDRGATVTWVNENETAFPEHTVTSDPFLDESADWSFDAELTDEGDEVSHTFESDGLYTYVGTVRGEECMCGLVAVGDASYSDPLPCSPAAGGGC